MVEITKDGKIYLDGEELPRIYTPNGAKININNKEHYVARLVAEKYLDGYMPFHTVRPINGDVTDMRADNLEIYFPSENVGAHRSSTRKLTLENKRTGEVHYFKSIADASEFLGYDRTYLSKFFYQQGYEELGWWHDYDIIDIDPNDTRVINRDGKKVTLRNRTTGEEISFTSLGKASKFLGRDRFYLKTRLRDYDNLPESCEYEILEIRG